MTERTTLKRFVALLLTASPRRAIESAVATCGLAVTEWAGLLLLVPLLQLVGIDTGQGALGRIAEALGRAFAVAGLTPTLAIVLVIYVVVQTIQALTQYWHSTVNAALQQDVVAGLRGRIYRAMARAQWVFVSRHRSSDFTFALTDEIGRVGVATYYAVDVTMTFVVSLVYLALALRVSPGMTAVVAACAVALGVVMRGRIRRARRSGEVRSAATSRLYAAITEHLGSLKTARSYGALARHEASFVHLSGELRSIELGTAGDYAQVRLSLAIGLAVILAAVVYVGYGVFAVSTAQLLVLLFLFARLMPRVTTMYERAQAFATVLPAFAALDALEGACTAAAEPVVSREEPIAFSREIRFDKVTFEYHEGGVAALTGVDCAIAAGQTTAIVGPSGAGKSTLVDLLMGLVTPREGRVLVDDVPLAPAHLVAWRGQIGYVAQETFLFHDTVRANLMWAQPDASEADVWRALRQAAADEFVAALPRGLDTVVGDRGVLLSGGERQRLSLARALVRCPRLLILDEATNAVDSENEVRIQRAVDALQHALTIVVITHRLSTIRHADVIHVLEGGRLVDSGTWRQLSTRPGRFLDLREAQHVRPATEPEIADVARGM